MKKAVSVYFAGALSLVFALESAAFNSQEFQEQSSEASGKEDPSTGANLAALNEQETSHEALNLEQKSTELVNSELKNSDADSALHTLLRNMRQFRASFEQTVVDAQQNIVHEAQGTLTMTRPNKLRWETTFPDETLLIADGEAVWNVDTFVEQVTVLSQEQAIKDNPIVLLTANDEATWDKFSIRTVDTSHSVTDDKTRKMSSFQVTPKQSGGQIVTLTLTFNQNDELAGLTMLDMQQQISALVFSDIETRFPLAADAFSVDVPDSYIVDDQR